ncbi:Protein kinase-like domain-containing protein [Rhodotorula toruloides]|uniref:non-specific serine/threonine protein kinase n=1 Tax=Rhodotorula toruloides TaxID=5286 RepID=A0A2T0ACH9_RHOTO|nr:Protein kinase-like domain-containing protein [Rhodotorula toruloides]
MNVNVLLDSAKDAFYALTGSCCKTGESPLRSPSPSSSPNPHRGLSDATLKLNGRSFTIVKLLGEGGFSYVYLARDNASGRLFALKKIRCPLGSDSVKAALKEVEAYKRFRHPNIIRCLDSCVVQDRESDGKVIYLFLPYYKNGSVQHVISANAVNGSRYPEHQMLSIFLGTCQAVRAMHQHKSGPSSSSSSRRPRMSPAASTSGNGANGSRYPPAGRGGDATTTEDEAFDEFDDEEEESGGLRTGTEGQALIGGLESAKAQLEEEEGDEGMAGLGDEDGATVLGKVGDGQKQTGGVLSDGEGKKGAITPWAHRDIKPANVMLANDGTTPILMDFGSAMPARIPIPDRRVALLQQDLAAEHCSMPFRAPELFDVKTGTTLTEAVDIWSLGCTLYAMAYGTSPFETAQQSEHGGSIAMAAMGGKFSFPDDGQYSERFRDLVRAMLRVNPDERPDIQKVIEMTQEVLARLQ